MCGVGSSTGGANAVVERLGSDIPTIAVAPTPVVGGDLAADTAILGFQPSDAILTALNQLVENLARRGDQLEAPGVFLQVQIRDADELPVDVVTIGAGDVAGTGRLFYQNP